MGTQHDARWFRGHLSIPTPFQRAAGFRGPKQRSRRSYADSRCLVRRAGSRL